MQLLLKLQVHLGVVGVSIREGYVQSKEQHPESQLPAENIHIFFKEKKNLIHEPSRATEGHSTARRMTVRRLNTTVLTVIKGLPEVNRV